MDNSRHRPFSRTHRFLGLPFSSTLEEFSAQAPDLASRHKTCGHTTYGARTDSLEPRSTASEHRVEFGAGVEDLWFHAVRTERRILWYCTRRTPCEDLHTDFDFFFYSGQRIWTVQLPDGLGSEKYRYVP